MPILKDVRETKTVELPSFKDSKVLLYKTLLTGQIKELEETDNEMDRGIKTLILLIKEWNFTDEADKPLPITQDSINILPIGDLRFLMTEMTEIFNDDEEKKKQNLKK